MSPSVGLSVSLHTRGYLRLKFLCTLHVDVTRASSGSVEICYVLRTSGFVDDVVFSKMGPHGALCVRL